VVNGGKVPPWAKPVASHTCGPGPRSWLVNQHSHFRDEVNPTRLGPAHVLEIGIGAAGSVDPAIHGLEGARAFLLHPEKFALAEIAVDEAPHHGFGRHAAPFCPADPVRDSRYHTMARALRGSAIKEGAIVLILGSQAPFRGVTSRDTELSP
jgi:hypothetical protein